MQSTKIRTFHFCFTISYIKMKFKEKHTIHIRGTQGGTGIFAKQFCPMLSIVTVLCVFVIRELSSRTTGTTGSWSLNPWLLRRCPNIKTALVYSLLFCCKTHACMDIWLFSQTPGKTWSSVGLLRHYIQTGVASPTLHREENWNIWQTFRSHPSCCS